VQCRLSCVSHFRAGFLLWLLLIGTLVEARENRIKFGVEQFDWREYDGSGKRLLTETGSRILVGFEHSSRLAGKDSLFNLAIRGYFGNVDYRGHLQHPGGLLTAYSAKTHYWGIAVEPGYEAQFPSLQWSFIPTLSLGAGGEWWLRDLRGTYGYKEYYGVGYLRFEVGLKSKRPAGWFSRLGIKAPFLIREKITEFYLDGKCDDVKLTPGKNNTLSFTIGYHLVNRAVVSLGYDGYRFSPSSRKRVSCDSQFSGVEIFQPRSEMSLFMLRYSVPL